MAENMFCPGQKTLSAEGKKNWDHTFKKERDTTCYCTVEDHDNLFEHDIKVCPRCGGTTDPRIDIIPDKE